MIGGGGGEIGDGVLCEGANRPSQEGGSFFTVYNTYFYSYHYFSQKTGILQLK